MDTQTTSRADIHSAIDRLAEDYRMMCLWFAPKDYLPTCDYQRLRTLEDIERYGDREAFMRSRELQELLLADAKTRGVDLSRPNTND